MATLPLNALAIGLPAAIAAGAYVNAKFALATDWKTIRHDREWIQRLQSRLKEAGGNCTLWGMFDRVDPSAEFLWFEGRTWTYGEMKIEVKKFAKVLQDNGLGTGDFIAVFTANSPEMVVSILAISRLGAVGALINTNLRGDTFIHCMNVSRAKFIISTPDLTPHVLGDLPHVSLNMGAFDNVTAEVVTQSKVPIKSIDLRAPSYPQITTPPPPRKPSDLSVLIYTSGTTGRPKACAIRNMQTYVTSNPLSIDLDAPGKYLPVRTYSPLPLFHGTGLFTGFSYTLGTGGSICIARKFSSSRFFKDVHDSKATRILYIGELCRYLLASAPSKYDQDHNCIVANGNGLRREIWNEFKERFNIPEIREFYRSTEGIAKFDNFGRAAWGAGKIGFAGPLRRALEEDTFVIRSDPSTGEPIRDPKTGFCIRSKLEEPGEAIGRVKDRGLLTEYLGNEAATEEKLLRDVFKKGDLYHRMGDLVVVDNDGWVRFHDRIGDSFRWKGENVSAGEVRDLICELSNVQDAVVFGVRLKSYDGQAGGAVISLKQNSREEREKLAKSLHRFLRKKGLPAYACPRLVRIAESIGTGVTFKQGKGDEAKKGWAPAEYVGKTETLYWLDGSRYRVLDDGAWESIEAGKAKL
ncbi:bifunctional fatty acid transporter synthetase (FAT1) [Coleophoma cylindrospora]|uniref:Bifunctional fatty acid transporter synthetase (FAT1) n=1 Tax=Coleophoma cylindrospora TaxID=1849047 RepID=A0A3D8SS64_9HELO|nr:bifunctional fatty acid transporter synthetase (FAT1) [Coleophoma cylindrospora]